MQQHLTIIALSLWLIVFLGATCVVYALISMWKENRSGHPFDGIMWFTLAIVCVCVVILFADNLEKVRGLGIISRRVERVILGF